MRYLWWLLLLFPIFVFFLPVHVYLLFNEELNIKIKIAGITVFKKNNLVKKTEKRVDLDTRDEVELIEQDAKKKRILEAFTDTLRTLNDTLTAVLDGLKILNAHLKDNLRIVKLEFFYTFGLGDAALTGVYAGAVYTVANCFYGYFLNNYKVKKHQMKIEPDFEKQVSRISFTLTFSMNLMHILTLLLKEKDIIVKLTK